jgi:hypothetical protein
MDLTSPISQAIGLLSTEATKVSAKRSLQRMFLLECKSNQKLLAIASWKDVSDGIRNEAFKNLSSDNAKAYYAVSDKSMLGKLLDSVTSVFSNETKGEKSTDTDKITSLITRTDAIRFLGSMPNELQTQSKAKYTTRINNLNAILKEVIEILEHQLEEK